jgi:hypothetical protein
MELMKPVPEDNPNSYRLMQLACGRDCSWRELPVWNRDDDTSHCWDGFEDSEAAESGKFLGPEVDTGTAARPESDE